MEDHQWFYNNSAHYQPAGTSDYNHQYQTSGAPIQYNQWNQPQSNSTFVPYPPVPSYPPPPPVAGPYSVPPPNIAAQTNFGYCYNYPSHQPVNQNQYWQNDYTKELENYKYIKSKIEEGTPESKVKESMDPNGNGATGETRDMAPAPKKSQTQENHNPQDLDFMYEDCDTHANEIAELYSYTEYSDLHYNLSAFEEQMAKHQVSYMTWRHFSVEEKTSIIMKILDQLEFSNKETRMKSARCILYITQGGWLGVQSDKEQLDSAREGCLLLYKLGAFNAFVDLLNLEIENRNAVKKSSVSLADSEDLRVILSVLYTITETIRNVRESEPAIYNSFCSELMNTYEEDLLILKLFNMLTKFCSGVSPHFPVKKILLLLWKLILVSLGGTQEMRQLKQEKRRKAGLQPQEEDTIEIAKTLRPSSPPAFAADLLEDQNQRRKRSLVKQSSLEDNETIDMDVFENNESNMKSIPNNQTFNKWQEATMFPEPGKIIKLPWKPKAHKRLNDIFLNGAREKFIGYSLEGDSTTLFGLPKPIHESVQVLNEHTYISLTELQIQREEDINRNPLTNKDDVEITPTEILYQAMYPNLPQYMICLLKILLATTSRTKTNNDSINILGDVLPKDMPMTVFQTMKLGIDVNRHKEIIVKSVSAILLLLLKHFKLNHVYQFEFMSQHLVFANCIPLILKFFNQEIINYVKAGNNIPVLDFPSCVLGDIQPDLNGTIEIGGDANHCWRNVFSSVNLLRVLNKLCKWKNSRIMMLVIFKSAPILKRTLKIRHAMAQLYVLKLLKMQAKYLGRNWRKSNLKTVSLIYQKVRHHLNDDWAYGNYLDAKPWDFQAEEITLRTAVDRFNNRRYGKNIENEFESVDNNLNSVLGHDFDLSTNFQEHYHLWLEDEVFNNEIEWEKIL